VRRVYITIAFAIILCGLACSKSATPGRDLSADDKHRLYQAAINTHDAPLIQRVTEAIGLSDASGKPTSDFGPFVKEHPDWASKNLDFVKEHLTPDKAKEYVNSHMPS